MTNWMQTYSGIAFDLSDPKPEQVSRVDIVRHLSKIARWSGATRSEYAYSVAEHSCVVLWIGLELARREVGPLPPPELRNLPAHLLLHDAHEAYTNDIISPLKCEWGGCVKVTQYKAQRAIEQHFGLPEPTIAELDIVKRADAMALRLERDKLLAPCSRPWEHEPPLPPIDVKLHCYKPSFAARAYYHALCTYNVGGHDTGLE